MGGGEEREEMGGREMGRDEGAMKGYNNPFTLRG